MVASELSIGPLADTGIHHSLHAPPLVSFTPVPMRAAQRRVDRAVRASNGHTVLVCAPAGTGKTILLADWIHRRQSSDIAIGWVDLADPAAKFRLWPAVSAALGVPLPSRVNGIPDTPIDEAAAVISALSARDVPAVLVLDDAHLITDPLALAGLEYFVEHAPAGLTVIVIGRFDPPLRWHALEMAARLTRIGAHDLAFDEIQTAALLAQHDCRLTAAELSIVQRLTRGWAGLVRIAAIHLAAHTGDRATAIAALSHGPRAVADFLVGELLTTISGETLEFLLTTAVPASFSLELAAELVGSTAPRTLNMLLRNNFPFESRACEDGVWYTYHPMLRSYLLAEAARARPGHTAEVHRDCARWFVAAGMLASALGHVLAEPGRPALGEFVRNHGPRMVFEGDGASLFECIDDHHAVSDDPFILLLRIADAIERADIVQAAALRELIDERRERNSTFVRPNLLRPFTDAVVAEVDIAIGREALVPAHTPAGHPDLDCYVALATAAAHTFSRDTRRWGEPELRHALALAQQAGLHRRTLLALTRLATAAALGGSLTLMRERAIWAVAFADDHGLDDAAALVEARVLIAFMAYLQADDSSPRTAELVPSARRLDGSTAPACGWHADVLAHLVLFESAPDRHAVADGLGAAMHRLLAETPLPTSAGGLLIQVTWALLRIRRGESAQRLLDRAAATLGRTPETALTRAALAQDGRRWAATVELVEPLLDDDELHPLSAIQARLLYATACHRLDRHSTAYEALDRAVALAHADRLIRPFLDVPGVLELLDRFVGRFGHLDEFIDAIRAHRHAPGVFPQLTDTELAVLRQLPSGMTTHSLAADMGVSINTVKTHMRGIYHKLGVRTRAAAIAHARSLGLT